MTLLKNIVIRKKDLTYVVKSFLFAIMFTKVKK